MSISVPDIHPPLRTGSTASVPARTVLSVFGTRPEIIKFAPVLQELDAHPGLIPVNVCTSQHTDLAAPLLKIFNLRIDHDLNVMRPGQSLNQLLARIVSALDTILVESQPDYVLVQGDTTSALAGAMAAFQRKTPIGHIEAGLRSGDPASPFPEEMNRILISQMATTHFAATDRNRSTLITEGITADNVHVTGNPIVDAVGAMLERDEDSSKSVTQLIEQTAGTRLILLTAHRRENFDEKLDGYFQVVREFVDSHPDVTLVFPVHPNPTVRQIADRHLKECERIHLIEPLPYPDFIRLMSRAWLLVSDSGGLQEEAPTLNKPLLIIRNNTERPEAIECGAARLVGENPGALRDHLNFAYDDEDWIAHPRRKPNPFGDGQSRQRITNAIASCLAKV